MVEERKQYRLLVTSYLKVSHGDNHCELGRVVDINTGGMRLCGAEPIQTDRSLTFRITSPLAQTGNREIVFDADVIWCRRSKNPGLYDTGIKLKDLPPDKIGLIEHILEKSSQEDRWLSVIKSIKDDY